MWLRQKKSKIEIAKLEFGATKEAKRKNQKRLERITKGTVT